MLEVNDFNAVRLSLASPAQIRSWSYGEVTKPETINYRTLKPEKDGLFCEKIFGPAKDFECSCGKYKRVRYKGIVCDKCGVEVTRSKVRRERMGHIDLAAPVTHIWFAKGVPSRLGLLLDIAPRTLERVIYFANYVITTVDEEARDHALQALQIEIDEEVNRREADAMNRIHLREEGLEIESQEVRTRRDAGLAAADAELATVMEEITSGAREAEADIKARDGEKLRAKMTFRDRSILTRGQTVDKETIGLLHELAKDMVSEAEAATATKKADLQLAADAAIQQKQDEAATELEPLRAQTAEVRVEVTKEYAALVKRLEKLRDPIEADALTVLTEQEHAELYERFGLVFQAGMGAESVLNILERIDLAELRERLQVEIATTRSGQKKKKATKRLRVVEALRKSGNRADWMIIRELPVLPPDLRPMVQLDGGRFATSDLNDLYRRVINRNNRLKRLLNLGAPDIIIRNEKRMLQEAVDSLIDNGRRGRAVSGSGNHKLKSLSDLLKGKQGRFRQNLLGKRVDYSGRSVIVVGPNLRLHQCGLPKKMALELFKPFIMHALVRNGLAHNIKSAKRIVERARPEVWDVLEEVITSRPVMLNRAPTLHRLGIQAFEPVLIEGSAIQLHPLVCFAYNADFDGDQMAVHVPLSYEAVAEARQIMLSSRNLLAPSDGEPVIAPTLDMVLGCYYMTFTDTEPAADERLQRFTVLDKVRLAYDLHHLRLQQWIEIRNEGEWLRTTVGRVLFNDIVPDELGFQNEVMDKKSLRSLVSQVHIDLGTERTVEFADAIKDLGFRYATQSGISISVSDIRVPDAKPALMATADEKIDEMESQFQMGLVTETERYAAAINIWTETTNLVQTALNESLDPEGPLAMMSRSGAKGNIAQIRQMAGLRGLMSDPSGRIIDLPIRSSFKEGLSVLEYFISTHGARKGLADTALRTADSGYLTRRMIDVAQDLIIVIEDCAVDSEMPGEPGIWIRRRAEEGLLPGMEERAIGRRAAEPIAHPETGEVIVEAGEMITEVTSAAIIAAEIERIFVRSPLTCRVPRGLCARCYGEDLATRKTVKEGVAVGIIAAQSIGEPGTQLTMRTFHTGGVAGTSDITSGLPRVEEIFEARTPKGAAAMAEIDGVINVVREGDQRILTITDRDTDIYEYDLPRNFELLVAEGDEVDIDHMLARAMEPEEGEASTEIAPPIVAGGVGHVQFVRQGRRRHPIGLRVVSEDVDVREYPIPVHARLRVEAGELVRAGEHLTEGALDPQDILRVLGPEAVQVYLVDEVQRVYRSQGVNINDRHIEVIVRQMLRKVRIEEAGDTDMLPSELMDRQAFEELNIRTVAEGGEPCTAVPVLLGVTRASLSTDSFLSAASFQETTRVLTDAAIGGAVDYLRGLKENVIIGKLIPASAEVVVERPIPVAEMPMPESLLLPFAFDFERLQQEEGEALYELMESAPGEPATSYVAEPD